MNMNMNYKLQYYIKGEAIVYEGQFDSVRELFLYDVSTVMDVEVDLENVYVYSENSDVPLADGTFEVLEWFEDMADEREEYSIATRDF